jgi:type VI secretion system protein ImpK
MTPAASLSRRQENLAFCYQELITVGERLRSNRQAVSDANAFRAQLWQAIRSADQEARARGYVAEDIELATFAIVAFLDESILNLRLPVFADWPRQPMQEERYGHHIAGEVFFQNLQKLLQRNDSQELADILEVYELCMLLGFAGRYSLGGRGELRSIQQQTGEKIRRIRQDPAALSPNWMVPNDPVVTSASDPFVKTMIFVAIGCVVLAAILFGVFKVLLGNGVSTLKTTESIERTLESKEVRA